MLLALALADWNQGQKALQSLPPAVLSSFEGSTRQSPRPRSGVVRVVKPHCHLFLMSSLIVQRVLSSDCVRRRWRRRRRRRRRRLPAWLWEAKAKLHRGFINVRESQASGNVFLLPVPDKHVSGQCLHSVFFMRRHTVHYKVSEWLL